MKKLLRFVGILLVTLLVIFVVLGLMGPKELTVTRSVVINAPKDAVWEQMVKFKNWPNWSPWIELDPTTQLSYSGTDGQVGSAYHWIGSKDKNTGEGDMTNKGVEGTTLNFEVHFMKPFDNTATGTLSATDTAGSTKATWVFNVHMNFTFRAFAMIMNMEKELGEEFMRGLNNMKKYVETHPVQTGGSIMETTYPGRLFGGIRARVPWDKMDKFFKAKYAEASMSLAKCINGPAASLTYEWDTVKKEADMAAVFPVADSTQKLKGISYFNVPATKAIAYTLTGPYSGEMQAHYKILKYVLDKGMTPLLVVEEYEKGPMTEIDSNKWETKIYYLVK